MRLEARRIIMRRMDLRVGTSGVLWEVLGGHPGVLGVVLGELGDVVSTKSLGSSILFRYLGSMFVVLCQFWAHLWYFSILKIIDFHSEGCQF